MSKRTELDNVEIIDHPSQLENVILLVLLQIIDHLSQLEREKAESWLKERWLKDFLPKLKRTTSRTQKCRLLESVERLDFEDDRYSVVWKFVEFDEKGCGTIFDRDNEKLEEFEQTELQKQILENDPSLTSARISTYA